MHRLILYVEVLFCVSFFPMVLNQILRNQRLGGNQHLSVQTSSKLITQSFQREPEYLEINPGENALMECRVFGKSRSSLCIWQKDGKPIRMQQDGKYEWYGGTQYGDCSLKIIKADINYDDGKTQFSSLLKFIFWVI